MKKMTRGLVGATAACLVAGVGGAFTVIPAEAPNEVGRVMAGMEPGISGYETFTATEAWINHRDFFEKNWTELSAKRLEPAAAWRESDVKPDPSLKTLFYPFSGPDFLNAYLFFPDCDTYVFYSLEAPGATPDLGNLSSEAYGDLLADIRESLDDIFLRQYFITKRMMKELRTPVLKGNTPLFLVFMARMNLEVLSVDNVRLDAKGGVETSTVAATGALAKRAAALPVPGVRITFRRPGGKTQTLLYYSVNVSNSGLSSHPEFLTYLDGLGTGITFMKSASYLLHGADFSKIRKSILKSTQYLLQDDSGLPFRSFGRRGDWDVVLYGSYTKAIKDFNGLIQKDMEQAYQEAPSRPLPFKFGYHWHDKYSNVQIAVRKR